MANNSVAKNSTGQRETKETPGFEFEFEPGQQLLDCQSQTFWRQYAEILRIRRIRHRPLCQDVIVRFT